MNKRVLAWPICLFMAMTADMLSTYYATPDLKNERNWFVSAMHFDWLMFLVAYYLIGFFDMALYAYHAVKIRYRIPYHETIKIFSFVKQHIKYVETSFILSSNKSLQKLFAVCINAIGYFVIRLSFLGKVFAAITNIIEAIFEKNYKVVKQSADSYLIIGNNSFLKSFPKLENIMINWIFYEDLVEVDWYPYLTLTAIFVLSFFFIRFEYRRMLKSQQQQPVTQTRHASLA